jgi:peptidylprolyl isomerase
LPGKTLTVDYKGAHYDTGKEFDSSWSTGQPFTFVLGARQVIKGWEQGIEGMRVGGRRQLTVPADLAYGDHGQGAILPNEPIVFVVDLLDVR